MISVCMACYNGHKYISQQIDSILCQLKEEDELIISDDGSKDDTCAIIEAYNDSRIKLLHNQGRHGYIGNFENALRQAKGDYIFLSDQDDVWYEDKVKVCINELQSCDLVVHNASLIDGKGCMLKKDYFSCMHCSTGFWANFFKPRYLGCCMAFNKNVYNKAVPFVTYLRAHDYWIGCIANARYKVSFIPDKLIFYRRHEGNFSPSSEKSKYPLYFKIWKRLSMLILLFIRFLNLK